MEILSFLAFVCIGLVLCLMSTEWFFRHVFTDGDSCGSCCYWFGIWEQYGSLCACPEAFKKLSLEGKNVELTHDPSRPKVVCTKDVRTGKNCGRFCKYYGCSGAPGWTW